MQYRPGDTIAAVATPMGAGGLAVVRISGPDSLAVADRVFRGAPPSPSARGRHAMMYGHIHAQGRDIDEVILLVMRAPHSYTCEDVVEIQGHGGPVVVRRILQRVLDEGVRLAGPGEFTLRAFLNGRLDLLQAEAVGDMIHARSERGAQAAMEQLEGSLSRRIGAVHDELLAVAASVEVTLDFTEEEPPPLPVEGLLARCREVRGAIAALMETQDEGRLLREGARLVICGRPNVGKSTLLNALLDTDRAIVSPTPGTTRDVIEGLILVDGIPVRVCDTAGLRQTECAVEGEGIRRSLRQMEQADLYLYVVDAPQPPDPEDATWLARLDAGRTLLVANKIDCGTSRELQELQGMERIETSLVDGTGVDALRHRIRERLGRLAAHMGDGHATVSARHLELLGKAQAATREVEHHLAGQHEGFETRAAIHLREAAESIGQIIGRDYHEGMLEAIFSRFCIGK